MAEKRARRAIVRKARINASRIEAFIADYINNKNNEIYNEAKQAYHILRNRYPDKLNLKLTKEYQSWKCNPEFNLTALLQPATRQTTPGFNGNNIEKGPAETSEKEPAETIEKGPAETIEKEPAETIEKGPAETIEKEPAETLKSIVEEVIDEATIEPSTNDVIPEERMLEIIKDLQSDPETSSIFSAMQEQFDFQQLGEDIEINDYDLLEKDLVNW